MSKSALVTGGAGFIGSHVVERLLREGWQVRVLDDLSTGKLTNLGTVRDKIEFTGGSITDSSLLDRLLPGVNVVFHLAAKVSVPESFEHPSEYERVNVHGTRVVLEAARAAGVDRVILSSTCAIYGDTVDLPISEKHPFSPLSPYAANKLAAEELGRKMAGEGRPAFTALRYFNVYGPRQDPRSTYSGVISKFIDALSRGEQPVVHGDGRQTRDFIHVSDVAEANLRAALASPGRVACYNVGTGRETSIYEVGEWIAAALGREFTPHFAPARHGDIRRSVADCNLVKRELGLDALRSMRSHLGDMLASPVS